MANHVVINTDKCLASKYGHSVSVVYSADLDNGSFVALGNLDINNQEVFNAELPSTPTTDVLVMTATPEFQVDLYLPGKTLKDFYNPAGKTIRTIYFTVGDILFITDNGIDGATVTNQFAVPQAGSVKLAAATDLSGGTRLAFRVIAKNNGFSYTGSTYAKEPGSVLLCVKA